MAKNPLSLPKSKDLVDSLPGCSDQFGESFLREIQVDAGSIEIAGLKRRHQHQQPVRQAMLQGLGGILLNGGQDESKRHLATFKEWPMKDLGLTAGK